MRSFRIRPPSPALAVSFVALLVALSGTSYAAFSLPKNSVGTKQLKNNAVTTKKIKNGAVTASKLNTSGLTVPFAQHASSSDTSGSATSATNANHASTADNATTATNATTAANANALGGSPPAAFESASQILSAVVTNDGATSTVVRGTPGTSASRIFTGETLVTFPRDVSNCTWIATQGNPGNSTVPSAWATVRGNGEPDVVWVVTYNASGNVDANFHLLVVC
jgi:hypothetical protein